MRPGTPTLDQLKVFLAITENGSFAGAARNLGRATSAVSYAVTNLELQLGVKLFDRAPTKAPRLTEAGKLILGEARAVSTSIEDLRSKVAAIVGGLEPEVSVAIDTLFPCGRLTTALTAFQKRFPDVLLRLDVQALGAVPQLVLDRRAIFGIMGPLAVDAAVLRHVGLGSVAMIPVASPAHPLAGRGIRRAGAGADHLQLVLSDRSSMSDGQEFQVTGIRTWRIADLGAKRALLISGLGWGNMPAPLVEEDLRLGRLVRLHMPDMGTVYEFRGVYRSDTPPGPAAEWLLDTLAGQQPGADSKAAA